jgi:hypothetical protein
MVFLFYAASLALAKSLYNGTLGEKYHKPILSVLEIDKEIIGTKAEMSQPNKAGRKTFLTTQTIAFINVLTAD